MKAIRTSVAWPLGRKLIVPLDEGTHWIVTQESKQSYRGAPERVLDCDAAWFAHLQERVLHHGLRLERTGVATFAVKEGRFRDRVDLAFSLIDHALECKVSLPLRIRVLVLVTTFLTAAVGAGLLCYAPTSPWLFAFPWMVAGVVMVLGMLYDINRSTAVRLAAGLGEALRMPQGQFERHRVASVLGESYASSTHEGYEGESAVETLHETAEPAQKTREI